MHGFLNIDKPAGMTSHDVVARVRRLAGRGVKVGHAGTLDPAATGVLPVALGHATRLIEYLADVRKGYRGLVRLGASTSTDDAEGEIIATSPVPPLSPELIEAAVAPLRGAILQVPPMYSALHHQGQRLYDLARAGKTVELAARPVQVDALTWELGGPDTLVIDVVCGKGTYIRSLARDIGAALGCGAHLAALQRTFVGPFAIGEAVALADLQAEPGRLPGLIMPPEVALDGWPTARLDAEGARRVRNGLPVALDNTPGEQACAYDEAGALLAVLRREGEAWRPAKVFHG
ncbi:tRNA pseudouridine(55) synthase TruB [Oscillochloris sp. ZM17-4]|uniref:tRNA pseudouridine(55) synthase TruB n=1 Tax=Oscillochloris sp. ZM17-4 TaxID=2866714 RepID=UPI001C72CC90|nr:tRNA pseudouridine(55) synthase TruB [Oscillochloris sp. ZM17-4]MBX0326206.1 tRNA pseudouridine(55) synthase TruB [Oscillochloris sp. ZM17-4]